jgi:hypothetical protein
VNPPTLGPRDDEKARVAFIDKIAAPVLNKMIECGMAP